jgi:hypothetical protein
MGPVAQLSYPSSASIEPPGPSAKDKEKRPRIKVQAGLAEVPSSEWASLLGDLSRSTRAPDAGADPVEFRVHDKTHIEFAIDYPFGEQDRAYVWEAFFFVPESFRIDDRTYGKKDMYEDLLSYVRLAVPEVPFHRLAEREVTPGQTNPPLLVRLERLLKAAVGQPDGSKASAEAVRATRVFACLVRASGLEAQRAMLAELTLEGPPRDTDQRAVAHFLSAARTVAASFREVAGAHADQQLCEELRVALSWVDEDISLVLEALAATASVQLQSAAGGHPGWAELAGRLAGHAVDEARYRQEHGWSSVGRSDANARDVEHLEFRRHVLKRFTSSVLWLKHEVRSANVWVVHALYALAAALAMAFAVVVSIRALQMQELLLPYVTLLVVSYAIKDRMKAVLQEKLSGWADKRFPDRRWTIRDHERDQNVGEVLERAGFRAFRDLPPEVLKTRRLTRSHALEESARPERVLWHEKHVTVEPRSPGVLRSPMLTEIFRMNIGPWLRHTDDPNRKITFADPDEASVYAATARRVYNLNIIYRLRPEADRKAIWHRIRVVVSRKGIERIEPIT